MPASRKNNLFLPISIFAIILFITAGSIYYVWAQNNQVTHLSEHSENAVVTTSGNSSIRKQGLLANVSQYVSEHISDKKTDSSVDLTKLPLGDGKYSTAPKVGYVYSCQTTFNGGGAFTQGPWINTAAGTWDLTEKVEVDGSVSWNNAHWEISTDGTTRYLMTNDLPNNHSTGNFPIAASDDAYQYDRNPNSIEAQDIQLEVPTNPSLLATPQCVGGEVGVMLSGVLLFNAFDAGGRDAVAMEVQDSCHGHPQSGGYYHYHGWSDCLEDETAHDDHSEIVGYAFDGFGIYGLNGEDGVELSSQDLDECHGHTHLINWDGDEKEMYHYHMTQDFPYSVGCFRGKPAVKALSKGEGPEMGGAGTMTPPAGGQQTGIDGQRPVGPPPGKRL